MSAFIGFFFFGFSVDSLFIILSFSDIYPNNLFRLCHNSSYYIPVFHRGERGVYLNHFFHQWIYTLLFSLSS